MIRREDGIVEHDPKVDDEERLEGPPRSHFVSAAFDDFHGAEEATEALVEEGFSTDRISVLLSEETRTHLLEVHPELREEEGHILAQTVELDVENKALKGAGVGSAVGGTIGAAAAAVAAVGTTVVIPPLGLVVAGPLAAALAGAGAGGAAGTVIGALTGAGFNEFRAKRFERLVKNGRVIVGARALTVPERKMIERVLKDHGGELVGVRPDA